MVGAGPAGLIAAEILAGAGCAVTVFDRMPSAGRKLLMAGRGGLNLTHGEPLDAFIDRYGAAAGRLGPLVRAFPPAALRAWAEGLGEATFVGSSGRVFPRSMKASPLLRAWLARLAALRVDFRLRSEWIGTDRGGVSRFRRPDGVIEAFAADATLLALGGASWPRLGSNGAWVPLLERQGVAIAPLRPANAGFRVAWSEPFRERFAGVPLKPVAIAFDGRRVRGEAVVTAYGIEGGAVYALAAALRDALAAESEVAIALDLAPDLSEDVIAGRLARQKAGQSLANSLRKAAGLGPLAANLLRETAVPLPREPAALAGRIKAARLALAGTAPIDRAISTAGGIAWEALDERMMLRALPGVFAAGEMIDWEAPTGGYLLQASFATGVAAAKGILARLGLTSREA